MDEASPSRRWLHGWRGIVAIVLSLLFLLVGLLCWWYLDTSDLEDIRANATAHGIPTSWTDTGIVVATSEQIARHERIGALANFLKDYDSEVIIKKITDGSRLHSHGPIPQAARDFHAAMDAAALNEFLTLIDQLPDHPIDFWGERTISMLMNTHDSQRKVTRLLGERVLLAPREHLPRESRRLIRFLATHDIRSMIELLTYGSCLTIATNRLAGRLPELKTDMPELADLLDQLSLRLHQQIANALIGEFLIAMHSVTHVSELQKSMGSFASSWDQLTFGPKLRLGRYPLLAAQLDWIKAARHHTSNTDLITIATHLKKDHATLAAWNPRYFHLKMVMGSMLMILENSATTLLRLDVFAAELRGTAWPVDAFDPSGKPLRRFERDGKLMGAYTVYQNQVDDGGDKKLDRYFPLYGPLELWTSAP